MTEHDAISLDRKLNVAAQQHILNELRRTQDSVKWMSYEVSFLWINVLVLGVIYLWHESRIGKLEKNVRNLDADQKLRENYERIVRSSSFDENQRAYSAG